MGTMRTILTILEAVACLLAFAVALYVLLKKPRANCPCDTCDHQMRKEKWNKNFFRYDCDMLDVGFDVPPQYCRDYIKRKDGGQNDVDDLVKRLRRYVEIERSEHHGAELESEAADAIESLKHTVEILCGVKINLVRCCECIYHDDESPYHYCRKWGRNCPNDSDFFCKWGKRKDGGKDDV